MAKVAIKKDFCKGCRLCIEVCALGHLRISKTLNTRGVQYAEIIEDTGCSGCGCCAAMCPDACIEVIKEARPKIK